MISRKEEEQYVKDCTMCHMYGALPPQEVLGRLTTHVDVGETICIDIVGPLPRTLKGNRFIMYLIDYASRYTKCCVIQNPSSEELLRALGQWVPGSHIPLQIFSDQAKIFTGLAFKAWAKDAGIRVLHSPIYSHKSAGRIERFQKTLMNRVKRIGVSTRGSLGT